MSTITTAEMMYRLDQWSRKVHGDGDCAQSLAACIECDLASLATVGGIKPIDAWLNVTLDALDGLTRNMIAMRGDDGTREQHLGRAVLSFIMLANEGKVEPDGMLADHLRAMLTCAYARSDREAIRAIRPMLTDLPGRELEKRHGFWAVIALTAIGRIMAILTPQGGDIATHCAQLFAQRIAELDEEGGEG